MMGGMGVVPREAGVLCAPGVGARGCWAAGAGVCGAGVCGAVGGASGAGVVAGAVSDGCGVAIPARHSSINAELPSSINRF
jgi:hypothetical protein